MSYNLQLRKKVINYIESGGNISKAAQVFGISRVSIYRWLNRKDLKPIVVKNRKRKLDRCAIYQDVIENPNARLAQRAKKFGVTIAAISYAFKKMKITRKKNSYVIENEVQNKE